jgi:hypothetical protein
VRLTSCRHHVPAPMQIRRVGARFSEPLRCVAVTFAQPGEQRADRMFIHQRASGDHPHLPRVGRAPVSGNPRRGSEGQEDPGRAEIPERNARGPPSPYGASRAMPQVTGHQIRYARRNTIASEKVRVAES